MKKQELRKKNFELRQKGKDPLKGWNKMVDTGMSGSCMRGAAVLIDITGRNLETYNFFSENQKQLATEVNQRGFKEPICNPSVAREQVSKDVNNI